MDRERWQHFRQRKLRHPEHDWRLAGPITINATCTDSRGLTASTSSTVTVENPPPPPPQATKVNECQYPNVKKPWRVDNTCKAALDDVALKLQQDPDAKLVVVGNADPKRKA